MTQWWRSPYVELTLWNRCGQPLKTLNKHAWNILKPNQERFGIMWRWKIWVGHQSLEFWAINGLRLGKLRTLNCLDLLKVMVQNRDFHFLLNQPLVLGIQRAAEEDEDQRAGTDLCPWAEPREGGRLHTLQRASEAEFFAVFFPLEIAPLIWTPKRSNWASSCWCPTLTFELKKQSGFSQTYSNFYHESITCSFRSRMHGSVWTWKISKTETQELIEWTGWCLPHFIGGASKLGFESPTRVSIWKLQRSLGTSYAKVLFYQTMGVTYNTWWISFVFAKTKPKLILTDSDSCKKWFEVIKIN